MKNAAPARLFVLSAALIPAFCGCFQNLSETEASDPGIKARLESQLRAQPGLDLRRLDIDVHSRVITFSGLADSRDDKERISQIAHGIAGADQVIINITVQE